jgi:hypothetical protein
MNVIRKDGITDYLPTFAFPETKRIKVIKGIPNDIDHREAIQNVARRSGYETKEFFFGVRVLPSEIIIGHYRPERRTEFISITRGSEGYSAVPIAACEWWKI